MLCILYTGCHLSHSPQLYTQVCRLMKAHRDLLFPIDTVTTSNTTGSNTTGGGGGVGGQNYDQSLSNDETRKIMWQSLTLQQLSTLDPMLKVVSHILVPALAAVTVHSSSGSSGSKDKSTSTSSTPRLVGVYKHL